MRHAVAEVAGRAVATEATAPAAATEAGEWQRRNAATAAVVVVVVDAGRMRPRRLLLLLRKARPVAAETAATTDVLAEVPRVSRFRFGSHDFSFCEFFARFPFSHEPFNTSETFPLRGAKGTKTKPKKLNVAPLLIFVLCALFFLM